MNGNPEPHRRVRRQGPATLRGDNIPQTTTDQRLLDRRGPSDWVHTDPWRVLRIQAEFVEGFGLLAELGPAVSIFGSARTGRGSHEYDIAERTAAGLARAGYAVITGGGPGIMEELFEALTLVATGKITKFPIVLVGQEYWSGLLSWLKETMLARANIGPAEFTLISVVDDPEEVVAVIREAHDGQGLLG